MADQAFVTLATNDSYAKGAMVLGRSLRSHKTSRKLAVLIGPHVSEPFRAVLDKIFDEVRLVDVLDSGDTAHLTMMERPDLGVTLTKLHCWTLTHYSKCVFMDADTMVLTNVDELFDREELSAAPDPGWPDCFNSGVFVFRPSNETYGKLLRYCSEHGSFDAVSFTASGFVAWARGSDLGPNAPHAILEAARPPDASERTATEQSCLVSMRVLLPVFSGPLLVSWQVIATKSGFTAQCLAQHAHY